jgi:hypothetical protein
MEYDNELMDPEGVELRELREGADASAEVEDPFLGSFVAVRPVDVAELRTVRKKERRRPVEEDYYSGLG